jgi:uncharacterized protein YfdQ (DUF2303 family)
MAVKEVDGLNYVVVPEGYNLQATHDLRPAPTRKTGVIRTRSVKDFIALVNREKVADTIILCDLAQDKGACRAIVDYHNAGGSGIPQWGEYLIDLNLTTPPEFAAWQAMFGRYMGQVAFAEFIEERHADISNPDGATILEVALTLQEAKKVEFVSGVRLKNGDTSLTYTEQSETKAGKKGDIEVPEKIQLFLPPYEGFGGQFIDCVLRYKIEGGSLSFMVKPMNIAQVFRQTREQVVEEIKAATGLLVADGTFTAMTRKV